MIAYLPTYATDNIAACARICWLRASFTIVLAAAVLAGCAALPDKPQRATLFDFGPGMVASSAGAGSVQSTATPLPAATSAAIALDELATSGGLLDNTAVLYRLAYEDAQELRAYSLARWTMPPAQLVRQRFRDQLGLTRPVYNARDSLALNRGQGSALPLQLRLELQEFSHYFARPDAGVGLVKLRGTLVEVTPSGEKLISQRTFSVQQPAPTADAHGGVRALTLATDAAIAEVQQWLQDNSKR